MTDAASADPGAVADAGGVSRVGLALDRLRRSKIGRRLLHHRLFMTGLGLFTLVVLMAAFANFLAPHQPNQNNFRYRLGAPNHVFLLGTDGFGRDVLSRVIYGARVSLRIGLMVVLMNGISSSKHVVDLVPVVNIETRRILLSR